MSEPAGDDRAPESLRSEIKKALASIGLKALLLWLGTCLAIGGASLMGGAGPDPSLFSFAVVFPGLVIGAGALVVAILSVSVRVVSSLYRRRMLVAFAGRPLPPEGEREVLAGVSHLSVLELGPDSLRLVSGPGLLSWPTCGALLLLLGCAGALVWLVSEQFQFVFLSGPRPPLEEVPVLHTLGGWLVLGGGVVFSLLGLNRSLTRHELTIEAQGPLKWIREAPFGAAQVHELPRQEFAGLCVLWGPRLILVMRRRPGMSDEEVFHAPPFCSLPFSCSDVEVKALGARAQAHLDRLLGPQQG